MKIFFMEIFWWLIDEWGITFRINIYKLNDIGKFVSVFMKFFSTRDK